MIFGRFSFTQTPDGNILGEFSNQHMNTNSPERARLDGNADINNPFVGNYNSRWSDPGGVPRSSTLAIELIPNTQLYMLTWINTDERIEFYGQGFIVDNALTGSYMDVELLELVQNSRANNIETI